MNLDHIIVAVIVGVAFGWLVRRWIAAACRRKEGGCAGDCSCSAKIAPKK